MMSDEINDLTETKKRGRPPKAKEEFIDLEEPQQKRIVAVDVGTMNLVAAEKNDKDKVEIRSLRNMYLPLDKNQTTMVEMSNIDYVESNDDLFIIGEQAYTFANMFSQNVKRPMSKGLISPGEIDGLDVLGLMMKKLCGNTKNGYCVYSVPAPSIDLDNNIIYHQNVFKRIFTDLGYVAEPFNEAMAIIYSQCQDEQFTGLAISFGAGMANVALSWKSVPILEFSVARSGDWIDQETAKSVGVVSNRITAIKERDLDLNNYAVGKKKERMIRESLVYHYREMIRYVFKLINDKLKNEIDDLQLPEEISIVVSGGTSLATGFLELFKDVVDEYDDEFPIDIKEIRHADDPLSAVAEGLLIKALTKN